MYEIACIDSCMCIKGFHFCLLNTLTTNESLENFRPIFLVINVSQMDCNFFVDLLFLIVYNLEPRNIKSQFMMEENG